MLAGEISVLKSDSGENARGCIQEIEIRNVSRMTRFEQRKEGVRQ
jgi:hypothetical protein